MPSISDILAKLNEKDVYSVLCGYLYEFKDIPEYLDKFNPHCF